MPQLGLMCQFSPLMRCAAGTLAVYCVLSIVHAVCLSPPASCSPSCASSLAWFSTVAERHPLRRHQDSVLQEQGRLVLPRPPGCRRQQQQHRRPRCVHMFDGDCSPLHHSPLAHSLLSCHSLTRCSAVVRSRLPAAEFGGSPASVHSPSLGLVLASLLAAVVAAYRA